MDRLLGELVVFSSRRGLELDGILYADTRNRTTIVHVHGSFGNFYQNKFIRVMAGKYAEAGINFLSFNTAGHDGLAEGYRNKTEFEYVGGGVAGFNECVSDIGGAVDFAGSFSDRIVLQGHSIGCDRILQYLIDEGAENEFVLLAPCDSYELQAKWMAPETVEEQIHRLKMRRPTDSEFDWLPSREYGVRQGKVWTYAIPITRKALLSIMEGPPFRLVKIRQPAEFRLSQRGIIYLGGNDALQTWPKEVLFQYFRGHVGDVTEVYVQEGDHMLAGCEVTVAERVVAWIRA